MKSFKELDAIIEMAIRCKLPKEIVLFENKMQKKESDNFFRNVGSIGVSAPMWPDGFPELLVDRFHYGGFIFHIIETDFNPNE